MADINDVLERLVTDAGFRRRLREDPEAALEGYDLDETELGMLAAQITEGAGEGGALEKRTSKSALAGLLGLGGGGESPAIEELTITHEAVELEFSTAGEPGVEDLASQPQEVEESGYLQIEMKDAIVTSYQTGDQPGAEDLAAEQPPPEEGGRSNVQPFIFTKAIDKSPGTEDLAADQPRDEATVQDLHLTKYADKSTVHYAEQPGTEDLAADPPPPEESGTGSGSGKANVQDLSLSKYADGEQPGAEDLAAGEQGEAQGDGASSTVPLTEAPDTSQGGDPDRPVVVGSAYNPEAPPEGEATPQDDAEALNPPVLDDRKYADLPNDSDQQGGNPAITAETAPGDGTEEDAEGSLAAGPEGDTSDSQAAGPREPIRFIKRIDKASP